MEYLSVKTLDNREFFTDRTNYDLLIEYKNCVGGTLTVVDLDTKPVVLTIEQLAESLCTDDVVSADQKGKKPVSTKSCKELLKERLLTGKPVSVAQLAEETGMTRNSVSSSVAKVRADLLKSGRDVVKIGIGVYQVKSRELEDDSYYDRY